MKRVLLKSRSGCQRCKQRRKKCDETKPVCGDCLRLGFVCSWEPLDRSAIPLGSRPGRSTVVTVFVGSPELDSPSKASPYEALDIVSLRDDTADRFDKPSILRTSAVPDNGDSGCKQILQYLCEEGAAMLKFPAERLPPNHDLNLFREGFALSSRSPTLLYAQLCLGAGHLCRVQPSYTRVALKYYNIVIAKLREELVCCNQRPPAEWACGVAAILSFYELATFHSPQSRLAHLVGYHRLVESRLYHKLSWGPIKMLLEQYIYSMTIGSLFHFKLLVGKRPIMYMDNLIELLNDGGARIFGQEIAGVPEELTAVAYRLSYLNFCNIEQSPWDTELVATAAKLASWTPAEHALRPSATGLLLVAALWQSACTCLLQAIRDRTADATDEVISASVAEACALLQAPHVYRRPFNSMVWPLTILSVFASNAQQRTTLEEPIVRLVEIAKIEGYRSSLHFLSLVEAINIGPAVFLRPDLLKMVYM